MCGEGPLGTHWGGGRDRDGNKGAWYQMLQRSALGRCEGPFCAVASPWRLAVGLPSCEGRCALWLTPIQLNQYDCAAWR